MESKKKNLADKEIGKGFPAESKITLKRRHKETQWY